MKFKCVYFNVLLIPLKKKMFDIAVVFCFVEIDFCESDVLLKE